MTARDSPPLPAPAASPSVPPDRAGPVPSSHAPRGRSGPPDVPVALVVAARKGDPAAFARMVEHWNPQLRAFVHLVLAGDGSTDRALSAAYVRAYRALPRYQAEQKPGLWLHRIAYLAATDELRRITRDPARRRAHADAGRAETANDRVLDHLGVGEDLHAPDPADTSGPADTPDVDPAFRVQAEGPAVPTSPTDPSLQAEPEPDVDAGPTAEPSGHGDDEGELLLVAGFAPIEDTTTEDPEVEGAIYEARTIMDLSDHDPALPPGWKRLAPDQRALAVLVDLEGFTLHDAARALESGTAAARPRLEATRRMLSRGQGLSAADAPAGPDHQDDTARATLQALVIPAAGGDFWSLLGRRLLAEREAPAAPSIDPMARLAQAHPAEPGFTPQPTARTLPGDPGHDPVHGLAEQADWVKPPRRWRKPVLVVMALLTLAGIVAAAVKIGTSSRVPDGSIGAAELAGPVSEAMATGPYRRIQATVSDHDAQGRRADRKVELLLAGDGSWLVSSKDSIDQTTYDATTGLVRRVAVVGQGDAAELFANDVDGLSSGSPDPAPYVPVPLDDLAAVPSLLRAAGSDRLPRAEVAGQTVYTLDATLPTGTEGSPERWQVHIGADTSLPVKLVRSAEGRQVRQVVVTSWTTTTDAQASSFRQEVPEGARVSTDGYGFATTELGAVPLLGRGEAVTPAWLPTGFELTTVAVRAEAPPGATPTAGGTNPADVGVMSLGFQRGSERITVSTRAAGADVAAWTSPFAPSPGTPEGTDQTLGDGRFNGARVETTTDPMGRAQLWGVSGDTVFTVSGDLTADQAFRLAASLR